MSGGEGKYLLLPPIRQPEDFWKAFLPRAAALCTPDGFQPSRRSSAARDPPSLQRHACGEMQGCQQEWFRGILNRLLGSMSRGKCTKLGHLWEGGGDVTCSMCPLMSRQADWPSAAPPPTQPPLPVRVTACSVLHDMGVKHRTPFAIDI